jgi:hypothetical protein
LCKHQDALSIDKYDLGLAKDFKHKIHLQTQDPVYQKQFKISEAHQQFIEQTLDKWLKLGVVKRSNSLYNSPISAFQRNKVKDFALCRISGAQPKLPYRQVLHERNHRMHRRHRQSQLQHFHNFGPDFRFLANATGRGLTKVDSFHLSGKRPVPLDHFTHGTSGLSVRLPMTNGRGTT